jgi:hypothetical protein
MNARSLVEGKMSSSSTSRTTSYTLEDPLPMRNIIEFEIK